jgi:hypothetical protein
MLPDLEPVPPLSPLHHPSSTCVAMQQMQELPDPTTQQQQPQMKIASYIKTEVHRPPANELGKTTTTTAPKVSWTPAAWSQSIIGRDWEVYWKKHCCRLIVPAQSSPRSTTTTTRTRVLQKEGRDESSSSSSLEEDDDEETWYDATVLALDDTTTTPPPPPNPTTTASTNNCIYFQVQFLGDEDKVYSMALSPDIVRPSARAWIARTTAILNQPPQQQRNWEEALPPDTSVVADHEDIQRMEQEIQKSYPISHVARFYNSSDECTNAAFCQLRLEHVAGCQLMKLLQCQIFLRSKLAPIESDDTDTSSTNEGDDDDDDDSVLTEGYVDFLVRCLKDLEQACQWHYQCWKLVHRLFALERTYQHQQSTISREYLWNDCLSTGRCTLTSLCQSIDVSSNAFQKSSAVHDRKRPPTIWTQHLTVSTTRSSRSTTQFGR